MKDNTYWIHKLFLDNKKLKYIYKLKRVYDLSKEEMVFVDKIYDADLSLEENEERYEYFRGEITNGKREIC